MRGHSASWVALALSVLLHAGVLVGVALWMLSGERSTDPAQLAQSTPSPTRPRIQVRLLPPERTQRPEHPPLPQPPVVAPPVLAPPVLAPPIEDPPSPIQPVEGLVSRPDSYPMAPAEPATWPTPEPLPLPVPLPVREPSLPESVLDPRPASAPPDDPPPEPLPPDPLPPDPGPSEPPVAALTRPHPTLVGELRPRYPESCRRLHHEGSVRLELEVGAGGQVVAAHITQASGCREMDRAALETARKLRFLPALRDGVPVASRMPFVVRYELEQ